MSTTSHPPQTREAHRRPTPATRKGRADLRRRASRRRWGWTAAAIGLVAIVVGLLSADGPTTRLTSGAAPDFALQRTDGTSVSLAALRGRPALLYFNEGVGCDVCFTQMVGLEADRAAFEEAGIQLVPIVMNGLDQVRPELRRFAITTPYAYDPGGSVSRSYDTLGKGHHAELPGHSFVLIGADGTQRWRGDYPGMWVDPAELAAAVKAAL
jgi:peroxiredoxin